MTCHADNSRISVSGSQPDRKRYSLALLKPGRQTDWTNRTTRLAQRTAPAISRQVGSKPACMISWITFQQKNRAMQYIQDRLSPEFTFSLLVAETV